MPLKLVIESLDDVEETQRDFYKVFKIKGADGKEKEIVALDVEDDPANHPKAAQLKNALERQKTDTARLKTELAELKTTSEGVPEDFTSEEWDRLKAVDAEFKKGGPDDPDKKRLHEAEVQSIKSMHAQELTRERKKTEDAKAETATLRTTKDAVIHSLLIGEGLTKALIENGVDKKYLKGAKALLEKSVRVVETDGVYAAVIDTDLGETPIDQFVPQWAQSDEGKIYVTPASGSDAPGNAKNRGGAPETNPWKKDTWNLTQQGAILKADLAKADRLAKSAGHQAAAGAAQSEAK